MSASEPALQAVIFDLDGTLMDHESSVRTAMHDWLPTLHDGSDELALVPGFRRQLLDVDGFTQFWLELEDLHLTAWRAGEIGWTEQRRRRMRDFLPHLGVNPAESELDDHFADYLGHYESHWHAYPDARPCLLRARRLGLATAVLTNGTQAQQVAKVAAIGLADVLGPVFASGGIGTAKPEEGAYRLVCERLSVDPAAAVMVGDNYELDVRAPRSAGLRAVHLHRAGAHRVPDPTRIATLTELALDDPALGTVKQ